MKSLEVLLEENYSELKDEECKKKTIEYIKNTKTVIYENFIFVKRLTKVASHIISKEPELLENQLEKLFIFHLEGILLTNKQLESTKKNNKGKITNLLKLIAHFYGHTGTLADTIFQKTREEYWRNASYNSSFLAAKISEIFDKKEAINYFGYAEKKARINFNETKNIYWAKKWFMICLHSAEISKNIDKKKCINSYFHAIGVSSIIYHKTKNIAWLEKKLELTNLLFEYNNNSEKPEAYMGFSGLFQIAMEIYTISKKKEYLEKANHYYSRFIILLEEFEKKIKDSE
jgi:hypothetical protein